MNQIRRFWAWLYPSDDPHRWMPLIWLPFMTWFFVDPIWKHAGPMVWASNTLVGMVFLLLYLHAFSHPEPRRTACVIAMIAIAALVIPFNSGAVGFLIYAAAAGGFSPSLRRVFAVIAVEVAIFAYYAYRLNIPLGTWASIMLLIILVGFGNHHWAMSHCQAEKLRLANDEIEHLAKVAERERIARDLHDVLGHTLSLITLKSELARKLVVRDPERAKQEMQDVENTSRAALADVREAIRGYRSEGFFAELARARAALETAGVTMKCDAARVELSPAQESVLALALREAVTNVVRHADAQSCEVRLVKEDALCRLEIADDGIGGDSPEGSGLRGMRERLQAAGGSLQRMTEGGTRLVIRLPLAPAVSALRN